MQHPNPLDDDATSPFDVAQEAATRINDICGVSRHDVALALGSGWGSSIDRIGEVTHRIPARELPGFTSPEVPGHMPWIGSVLSRNDKRILVLGARNHLYEGRGVRHVAHGARVAAASGAETFVITNASGGIRDSWSPGTAVMIRDHINFTGTSPVEGAHFIDMTEVYSSRLRSLCRSIDPSLDEGVYFGLRGPQYETPAEIRAARSLGADMVGMSTVCEAIAARECDMEVLGLALITNYAAGVTTDRLSHEAVLSAGVRAEPRLSQLLDSILNSL